MIVPTTVRWSTNDEPEGGLIGRILEDGSLFDHTLYQIS